MVDARTARYLACADAESLVALHQEMLTSYGFRCFIYATNPIAAEFGKTGHAHDNRILHNCPKTLIARYVGENLYRICPIVKWAMSNTLQNLGRICHQRRLMEPRYLVPSASYMSFLRLTRSQRDIQFRCHGATMRQMRNAD